MSTRQLSESSMLVDLKSTDWVAIALPPNFGQHSVESIAAEYGEYVDDLPRPLLDAVLNGFDWTKWRRTQVTADAGPFGLVGNTQSSQSLTLMGVQLLRSMVRMRTACIDWRRVSGDFEEFLEEAGQVLNGKRIPQIQLSDHGLRELATQKAAWESAFLEISVDWFGLLEGADATDFISWDRKRRQESRKARVTC